ncbi:uncharacterized protein TrAtP1_000558 [Trichoderma atroviride]|uniref:uncharacterized protein n=1 Tax=Hypocrea atroviridis TaxID=63577 RepID=UPI003321DF2C|nr:hypothetical protein TrAtP1_000558 [Trichoderma atroviride]
MRSFYLIPPQFESIETIAICSIIPSYCSTLLLGRKNALKSTERYLTRLFNSMPSWPSDFSWQRFHQLPIEYDILQERQKWGVSDTQDLGLVFSELIMKSLSAGCRGLGELLGLGKISWEAPNISEARYRCIYALDLMAGINLGSQDEEAAVSMAQGLGLKAIAKLRADGKEPNNDRISKIKSALKAHADARRFDQAGKISRAFEKYMRGKGFSVVYTDLIERAPPPPYQATGRLIPTRLSEKTKIRQDSIS